MVILVLRVLGVEMAVLVMEVVEVVAVEYIPPVMDDRIDPVGD